MKKKLLFIIAIILLITLGGYVFFIKNKSQSVSVKVASIRSGEIARYINTTGTVKSKEIREYYEGVAKVTDIKVNVGDVVKEGDILATLEYGNLISKSKGTVTDINVNYSNFSSATPLIVVQNLDNLELYVYANQNDSSYIELNQKCIIRNKEKDIQGKVKLISSVAKTQLNSMDSEPYLTIHIGELENINGLIVGFKNEVDILVGERENTLVIPAEAVVMEKGSKSYVFVVNGNTLDKREIKVGLEGEMEVEVLDGVQEGEEVVLNPLGNFKSGTIVEVEE